MSEIPFDFEVPVTFFEKAGAEPGKERRIGGLISSESPDRMGEVILQRGLDFGDFMNNGWFNDNHSKATDDILGYPEQVKQFQKGQKLPNGKKAEANGTWAEGYLLDTKKADKIWELGKALQKTNRRLGFSVEGSIQRRIGPKTTFQKGTDGEPGKWVGSVIAKAKVREVAVTKCPVNATSKMDILTKSLLACSAAEPDELEKALGMGTATGGVPSQPAGSQTGETAGQVLATESLEQDENIGARLISEGLPEPEEEAKKSFSDAEAIAWFLERRPRATLAQAGQFVDLTKALKRQGQL